MCSLMSVGFLMYLFINDFLPQCFYPYRNLIMLSDWGENVMSVLGTTKHS